MNDREVIRRAGQNVQTGSKAIDCIPVRFRFRYPPLVYATQKVPLSEGAPPFLFYAFHQVMYIRERRTDKHVVVIFFRRSGHSGITQEVFRLVIA